MLSPLVIGMITGIAIVVFFLLLGFNRRVKEAAQRLWKPGDIWVGASMFEEEPLALAGLTRKRTRAFGGTSWTGCLHVSSTGLSWEPFRLSRWLWRADAWTLPRDDIRSVDVDTGEIFGRHECDIYIFMNNGKSLNIRIYSHADGFVDALRLARLDYTAPTSDTTA